MSIDYYLKCNRCDNYTMAFTNFERNPEYLKVMRFLMEHKHNCGCGYFEVLSEHALSDDDLMGRHKNNPPYEEMEDETFRKALKDVVKVKEIKNERNENRNWINLKEEPKNLPIIGKKVFFYFKNYECFDDNYCFGFWNGKEWRISEYDGTWPSQFSPDYWIDLPGHPEGKDE